MTAAIARTIKARRSDLVPGSNANGNTTNAASDKWADRISANPIGPEPGNGMSPPRSRAATANTYPANAAVNRGTRVRGDRFRWEVPGARTGRSTLIATPTIAQAGALRASGSSPVTGTDRVGLSRGSASRSPRGTAPCAPLAARRGSNSSGLTPIGPAPRHADVGQVAVAVPAGGLRSERARTVIRPAQRS